MAKPKYTPHPSFRSLYEAYTGPDSIGLHLTRQMVELTRHDPLLVVTGSDYVLFPGAGKRPIVEGFRNSTRGFVELTAISHLGPAIAWIFRLRELGHAGWREDAERLIERTTKVREFNTEAYWTDEVAVEAWAGYESRIVDLVDYTCDVTLGFLSGWYLADESRMTFENLPRSVSGSGSQFRGPDSDQRCDGGHLRADISRYRSPRYSMVAFVRLRLGKNNGPGQRPGRKADRGPDLGNQ